MEMQQKLRTKLIAQGECSVATQHTALLVIPEETAWAEDVAYADVYGVDSAEDVDAVLESPERWEPAGRITGDEYAALEGDFEFSA